MQGRGVWGAGPPGFVTVPGEGAAENFERFCVPVPGVGARGTPPLRSRMLGFASFRYKRYHVLAPLAVEVGERGKGVEGLREGQGRLAEVELGPLSVGCVTGTGTGARGGGPG